MMKFNNIYQSTPEQVKLDFMDVFLKNKPEFQSEFIEFVTQIGEKKHLSISKNEFLVTILEIEYKYKKKFEAIDLENPDWENYLPPHDGYIEDWEQYQQASEQEFEAIFDEFLSYASNLLQDLKIDFFLASLIGLYEACNNVELEDPCCSFDSVNDFLMDTLKQLLNTISGEVKRLLLPGQNINHTFESFFAYCNEEYPSNQYFPKFFEPILLALSEKSTRPELLLKILTSAELEKETMPGLRALLLKNNDDESGWLKFAQQNYMHDKEVAYQLCIHYMKAGSSKFNELANELFENEQYHWANKLQDLISPELNKPLFIKIQWQLALIHLDMQYYLNMRSFLSDEQKDAFVSEITSYPKFQVQILEVEGRFEAIKEIVSKNTESWNFNDIIKPILNIYPAFCFKTIEEKLTRDLNNSRGRSLYERIATRLKLAKTIQGYQLNTQELIIKLYNTKPNLPALKDEFRKAGLV